MMRDAWDQLADIEAVIQDFLEGGEFVGRPFEVQVSMAVALFSGFFFLWLASLVFKARRGNPADYAIAIVFMALAFIFTFSAFRIYFALVIVPGLTVGQGLFLFAVEIIAIGMLIREMRMNTRLQREFTSDARATAMENVAKETGRLADAAEFANENHIETARLADETKRVADAIESANKRDVRIDALAGAEITILTEAVRLGDETKRLADASEASNQQDADKADQNGS